jgi:uncharacterized protein YcfJ
MYTPFKPALLACAIALSTNAAAQITFFEAEYFDGRSFTASQSTADFRSTGFNDRASSVVVMDERWEVCTDAHFNGQCMVLRPGRYPSLAEMGMNDQVSSARVMDPAENIDKHRLAPTPAPVYDSRRRSNERLFEADVLSARAVVGPPSQRCWMEREDVPQSQSQPNMGGAVAGALLGGILGHQVGGGVGKDLATIGGAVAGAAVGAQVGREAGKPATQREVKRCAEQPASSKPAFWDVRYRFRGRDHQVQMTNAPGDTITVNNKGEPRSESGVR